MSANAAGINSIQDGAARKVDDHDDEKTINCYSLTSFKTSFNLRDTVSLSWLVH